MKFCYTVIFSVEGLVLSPGEGEKELVVDSAAGVRAILTPHPDSHAFEGDRRLAVAGLMLGGLFKSESTGKEFKQRVANATEELRAQRHKEFGHNPFLIFFAEGTVPTFNLTSERDAKDFIICLEGADEGKICGRFDVQLTALLASITSVVDCINRITKVTHSVVFFREDGKPVYSYAFSMGPIRVYLSNPLADDQIQEIETLYYLLTSDPSLQRVQRLIRSSFETDDDPLRSFLAAWTAFEIFVNSVFRRYEPTFFDSVLEEGQPEPKRKYQVPIQDVMKGKHGIAAKFAAVSFHLSADSGGQDWETVDRVEKVRNDLVHGEKVDESSLPVKAIRDLASKYLRVHTEYEQMRRA